jgi:archaeal flagellar protein FlaI
MVKKKINNQMKKENEQKKVSANSLSTREAHEAEKSYDIEVDGAKVHVEIKQRDNKSFYELKFPQLNIATEALLREVRNELISTTTVNIQELSEQESFLKMKQRFLNEATAMLKKKLPHINPDTEKYLIGVLIQDMLGLGKIEFLISDPNLEEIVIQSSKEPVRVFSKKYGWLETNLKIATEDEILNYANIIARRIGRQITVLDPLLDAHLVTGDRINAVLHPVNSKGNTITIRKFSRDPYTIIDLIQSKTCNLNIASLLWLAIEYEMNIIVSGGTASGKTSFLNACMPFIPPNQRIISIEDTRELILPEFLYWNPMVTRTPNSEGKGQVTMLDLLVNSLRMRPDRIILGEMRKHEEAMVLFEAMHTGHSVYATVHADSASETISRLVNPPLSVPANLLKTVNLNVVMFRDRRRGMRRVLQIGEFEASKDSATANILYRWIPEKDEIVEHSESSRIFEDLSRHTGMSENEIQKNLEEKKKVLDWLGKNRLRSIDHVSKAMQLYYQNKPVLLEAIRTNKLNLFTNG